MNGDRTFARGAVAVIASIALAGLAACSSGGGTGATEEAAPAAAVEAPAPAAAAPAEAPEVEMTSPPGTGTIQGRVVLDGPAPANPPIRMGADPVCASLNRAAGIRPVQALVTTGPDGGLANVFVHLDGSFPDAPMRPGTVNIRQENCIYLPRVVGAQVGQTLVVTNDDDTLHNVHSQSTEGNDFNASQPVAGIMSRFELTSPEQMLHVTCDVHSWMTAYVGVLDHPYFDTTGDDGTFTIYGVPPGTQTITIWHEVYGEMTQTVDVAADQTATVDFTVSPPSN